ncbi:hypothetical protein GGS21DRAFT_519313 [Xylaria nigripes]|nr:hypothetical protein GGS21DRAFT_519313 [Xylaria nigripes]
MAEPTNTPMPTAPPTRSSSPAPPLPPPASTSPVTARLSHWSLTHSYSRSHSRASSLAVPFHTPASKPVILHLGDAIQHNTETYAELTSHFEIVRPSPEELTRPALTTALRAKKWGDIVGILRTATSNVPWTWDAELIGLLPDSVRVIASSHDTGADTKAFEEKGILYCDASLAAAEAVADFATAQIISTFRALPHSIASATQATPGPAPSRRNLRGHVLGLVGFGDVGQLIARRCAVFGMQILYYDDVKRRNGSVRARCMASLEALVRASDCVVLCDLAGRVFDREFVRWLKRGARLVSVAAKVDQDALAEALEAGWLAGVALDVRHPGVGERLGKFAGSTALLTCSDAPDEEPGGGVEEICMRNVLAVLGEGVGCIS